MVTMGIAPSVVTDEREEEEEEVREDTQTMATYWIPLLLNAQSIAKDHLRAVLL